MKAKSLLHLLLMRARTARENTDPETAEFFSTVCESLEIEYARGWYEVKWRWQNKRYSLNLNNKDFDFYIRGDKGANRLPKGARARNWTKAGEVWQRVAAVSQHNWTADDRLGPMGLTLQGAVTESGVLTATISAGLAAATLGVSGYHRLDVVIAVFTAVSLTLLLSLSRGVCSSRVSAVLTGVIIGVGTLVPALLEITPLASAGAVAIVLLTAATEQWSPRSILVWSSIGLAIGFSPAAFGAWMIPPGAAFVVAILGIHVLLPNRFGGAAMIGLVTSTILASVTYFFLPPAFLSLELGISSPPEIPEATVYLALSIAVLSFILFLTDWFFGELKSTVAWIGLGYIGVAVIAAQSMAGPTVAVELTATYGYLVAIASRLLWIWHRSADVASRASNL